MNRHRACEDLKHLIGGSVSMFEPMSKHTSWRIGGPAELFLRPAGPEDLQRILAYARSNDIEVLVFGNGSNLLVSDKGIGGMVVQVGRGMDHLRLDGRCIIAGAGVKLGRLVVFARENALAGFEFAAGIPGTVGGALVMNAGANGSCMGDLVRRVTTVDLDGTTKVYSPPELDFAYRSSCLRQKREVVVETTLEGTASSKEKIKAITREYLGRRKRSQPLNYPSAGSVFKNPPGDSAGRLIDTAGAKGLTVGDAQVSTKHANFLINRGSATAGDMLELIRKVQRLVLDKHGVSLSLEVQLVGEHLAEVTAIAPAFGGGWKSLERDHSG